MELDEADEMVSISLETHETEWNIGICYFSNSNPQLLGLFDTLCVILTVF